MNPFLAAHDTSKVFFDESMSEISNEAKSVRRLRSHER